MKSQSNSASDDFFLARAVQQLTLARGVDAITPIVADAARKLTGADGASFVLREGDLCHYVDENAIGPLWKGKRFSQDSCISGWVMKNASQAVVEDILLDDRIPHDAYKPTFVRSLAMVPIRAREAIGAIGVYWSVKHLPSRAAIESLQALADATSVAFENLELHLSLERRIDELTAANKTTEDFLAILSHELRTPLTAIRGWSQILLSSSMPPADVQRGLEAIERNARAQENLVDDLLDVSRILSGRLRIEKKSQSLMPPVLEAIEALRGQATTRGVNLSLIGAAPTLLHADPGRLRQVASNLISNAIKFSDKGTTVSIELTETEAHVTLRVIDQGRGIEPSDLPHIFKRFWQADSSMSRRAGGLGLGLAIVKYLVDMHDGTITAQSGGIGRGACFTVVFQKTKVT